MSDIDINQYTINTEPFYEEQYNEVALYEAAYASRLPVMIKGPTGCGKSRFIEYMAWKLQRPLITVACNEDMTAGCRWHPLAGWAVNGGGAYWCNLLSR